MAIPISQKAPAISPIAPAGIQAPAPADSGNGSDADSPMLQISLKASQSEVEDAIEALRAAGLDTFADLLQKAMPSADPNAMDATSQSLQDDIVAMQPRN